jgi:hypothetical protein
MHHRNDRFGKAAGAPKIAVSLSLDFVDFVDPAAP